MAKARRTVIAPLLFDLAEGGGAVVSESKLAFWKQILPETAIDYIDEDGESHRLDFNREYLTDLAEAFGESALDQTPFMLADKDNRHTMDAERYRGEVTAMVTEDELPADVKAALVEQRGEVPKGLYSRLAFATKKAAKAVRLNPKLGVSPRIREDIVREDGRRFKRAVIHVLGTLDPKVHGMAGFVPALDLSEYALDDVLDLSGTTYPEVSVPKKNKSKQATTDLAVPAIEDVDPAEIAKWDDATLAAFLDKYGHLSAEDDTSVGDEDDEDDDDEDDLDDDEAPKGRELQEASLSNSARREIDLANTAAREGQRTAREALSRVAAAEWRSARDTYLRAGVPPHILDLAEPLLRGADDFVIDLSNVGGTKDVNASLIVRKLVEGYEGTIDLSGIEFGHGGAEGGDPDAEVRAAFDEMTADL